jgi:Uma2 family endonuclease
MLNSGSAVGEPTWEVAMFFPSQGEWTEADYLALQTNHLVELSEGFLDVLPMPTHAHQMIVAYLYELLKSFANAHAPGVVLFAPLRVRLWQGKFREPDVLYMRAEHRHRIHDFWEGADLVMEVVSPSKPEHDRETKRVEYAQAGISEYWIVDTLSRDIQVFALQQDSYKLHGRFLSGTQATSQYLPGFSVSVDSVMALASTSSPPA